MILLQIIQEVSIFALHLKTIFVMGANSEFLIPFTGLHNEIHEYRFQVRTDFFKTFENSRIKEGDYEIDLALDKREQMMILDFSFTGKFRAACDRCLSRIDIPSEGSDQIIVKIESQTQKPVEENVIFLNPDAHHLDVAGLIHDALHLHLPIKNERDCEAADNKSCDRLILDKIDQQEKVKSPDHTWDVLKELKLN